MDTGLPLNIGLINEPKSKAGTRNRIAKSQMAKTQSRGKSHFISANLAACPERPSGAWDVEGSACLLVGRQLTEHHNYFSYTLQPS